MIRKIDFNLFFNYVPDDILLEKAVPGISAILRKVPEIRRTQQITSNILKFNYYDVKRIA